MGRTVPWKWGASEPGRQHPLWLQGERGDNGSQVRRQTQIASTTNIEIKLKPGRHAGHNKCYVDKEPEAEGLSAEQNLGVPRALLSAVFAGCSPRALPRMVWLYITK